MFMFERLNAKIKLLGHIFTIEDKSFELNETGGHNNCTSAIFECVRVLCASCKSCFWFKLTIQGNFLKDLFF